MHAPVLLHGGNEWCGLVRVRCSLRCSSLGISLATSGKRSRHFKYREMYSGSLTEQLYSCLISLSSSFSLLSRDVVLKRTFCVLLHSGGWWLFVVHS